MTGGWAATNTLRVNAQHFLEGVGALIPGAKVEHSEDCPGCKQEAALALVEAALDAAEKTVKKYTHNLGEPDEWRAWNNQDGDKWPDLVRLAAALRAIQEEKL